MGKGKFHITSDGRILPCKADKVGCKYAQNHHFDSPEQAQLYLDDECQASVNYERMTNMSDEDILRVFGIREKSKIKEFKALKDRIDENKLYGAENPKVYVNLDYISSPEKAKEVQEVLNLVMPGKSEKAFHLVAEDSYNYYVWTNSSDQRDVIVYDKYASNFPISEVDKKNKYITHIEVKDLTKGAQLSATELKRTSTKGLLSEESVVTDKIKEQLKEWDPRKNAYENTVIKLTKEEQYDYLLNDYYNKKCKMIMFYSDKDRDFIKIYLTEKDRADEFKKAKEVLNNNNIEVEVNVRCNNTGAASKKISKADKQRFLNDYGSMFKDGVAKEKFTIEDLKSQYEDFLRGVPERAFVRDRKVLNPTYTNPAESKRDRVFIRLGDYVWESKDDDYIPRDREFTLDDFKLVKPLLTGTIKQKK